MPHDPQARAAEADCTRVFKGCVGAKLIVPAGQADRVVLPGLSGPPLRLKRLASQAPHVLLWRFTGAADATLRVDGRLIAISPLLE